MFDDAMPYANCQENFFIAIDHMTHDVTKKKFQC